MSEETVNPPDIDTNLIQENVDSNLSQNQEVHETESVHEETKVPLSALQKERKKRQEVEQERDYFKSIAQKPVDDSSAYESVTKQELGQYQAQVIRAVEENSWIKQNSERYEYVTENLENFLKQRPNLASAINAAPNRYEEAWELMSKLSPKQQQQLKGANNPVKRDAPLSPAGVPKAAGINQAVDVMNMSDKEYQSWRSAQKRRR